MNKRVCVAATVGFAFFFVGAIQAANVNEFADFSLRSGTTTLLPGRLYIPPVAITDPSVARPLILFMHGSGESGVNNSAQVNGNIDNLLAEAKRRSAFLYAPQTNGGWNSATILDRVKTMIDQAVGQQAIDAARLYATGLSMGGGGTWNMLHRFDDLFAAGAPVVAVGPASGFVAANMLDEPVWAFHARDDTVVSNLSSRNVINSILTAGQEPLPAYPAPPVTGDFAFVSPSLDVRYTEYRQGGHGIWGRVYSTPAMYEWLFSHTSVPEPGSAALIAMVGGSVMMRGRHRWFFRG